MRREPLCRTPLLILAVAVLAACGAAVGPTPSRGGAVLPSTPGPPTPTSPCPSLGATTISLSTPQPADVLLELAWEGGLTRPELAFAFGRVPEFSLLPDGSATYLDPAEWDKAQVMVARLTRAEAQALVQRVLDLGFERLESYTDSCRPQADGSCMCVMDSGESVLRLRLPGGELREIRNYADFADDPQALLAIRTLLHEYRHPQAVTYKPDKAALFLRPVSPSSDLAILDWPLHPAWLAGGAADTSCVRVLSGGDLQALLAVTGRNMGDFYFRAVGDEAVYNAYLVPWLPGVDYTEQVGGSGLACPPAEALSSPCARPGSGALASRPIVEEHPFRVRPRIRELGRTAGPGFWTYFERNP